MALTPNTNLLTMAPNPSLFLALKLAMAATLAAWACVWILKPTQMWKRSWHHAEDWATSTFLGPSGLDVAVFCLPVLAVATLAYIYLHLCSREQRIRRPMTLMANFSKPIIVNSPVGILSATELVAATLFIVFLAWTYYSNISTDFKKMTPSKTLKLNRWQLRVLCIGVRFGSLSEACLALLLLPVLREMALFRIFGVQYEASVRYHVWIGNGIILFSVFHGATIMSVWGVKNIFWNEITKWQRIGRVNLAGGITLATGLIIWITSLPPIRRKQFKLFYIVHHLYALFLIFFLLHAGDRHFYLVFSGVLLFALDKVLRIIQSRRKTCVVSARILECNAVEVSFLKHLGMNYTPTSMIFLNIPSISKFQWHPFSITSSSNMDYDRFSVLVKCQGQWTDALYNLMSSKISTRSNQITTLPIAVEGPYGPANIPYQRYHSLFLVAGGSGITPFLSIIQDIASKSKNSPKVRLIYVVKRSKDLSMLAPVSQLLLSNIAALEHLKLNFFVTQEDDSGISARELLEKMSVMKATSLDPISTDSLQKPEGMLWKAAITGLSSLTFLASIVCFSHIFAHQEKKSENKRPSWFDDLLVFCSFVIAISCSTVATVVLSWRYSVDDIYGASQKHTKASELQSVKVRPSAEDYEINFGKRPNLVDILYEVACKTEESDVGVFVCGPDSMERSVASFCRTHCGRFRGLNRRKCLFAFHSLKFSL